MLTPEDKQRIEAEERYRAQIRAEMGRETGSSAASNRKWLMRITVVLGGIALLLILAIYMASGGRTVAPEETPRSDVSGSQEDMAKREAWAAGMGFIEQNLGLYNRDGLRKGYLPTNIEHQANGTFLMATTREGSDQYGNKATRAMIVRVEKISGKWRLVDLKDELYR